MTRAEIIKLEPGPELDALVADKVLGLERLPTDVGIPGMPSVRWLDSRRQYISSCPPRLSKDMGEAWAVVEALGDRYYWRLTSGKGLRSIAGLTPHDVPTVGGEPLLSICADSMPHAICLVALVAVLDPKGSEHECTRELTARG